MICYRCFDCLKWLEAKELYMTNTEKEDYLVHKVQMPKRIVDCGPVKRIEVQRSSIKTTNTLPKYFVIASVINDARKICLKVSLPG